MRGRINTPMEIFSILLLCLSLTSIFRTSIAVDAISATESIRDGQSIVSASGRFELGFFRPGNSVNRFLGIWFKNISNGTVVWVANRETPLTNSSGVLKFDNRGILVLLNQDNVTIWSANTSGAVQNPVARLLDSGNFVIRNENGLLQEDYLWQSFHYPDQTFLPGMRIGKFDGGLLVHTSSWKSVDDPSKGDFISEVDSTGIQLATAGKSGLASRSGPWNGIGFSGMTYLRQNPIFKFAFVHEKDFYYYTYDVVNRSVFMRLVLNQEGIIERYIWIDRIKNWAVYSTSPADNCDNYALCGVHGICDITNSPACSCLDGFVPKYSDAWNRADWSGGCVRRTALDCKKGDGFIKYSNVKLPDMLNYTMTNTSLTLKDCEMMCLANCSCTAYANLDIRGSGSGCYFWFGDLIDIKQHKEDGQDLYIRMGSSELDSENHKNKVAVIAISVSLTVVLLLVLGLGLFLVKIKKKKQNAPGKIEQNEEDLDDLPHFDFSTIARATNNFSTNNMLGKGGFGPVYKGILNGQEVAVKRLSRESTQGLHEFKNEVKTIAKLQHRNLVKLLGFCFQLEEKMLIYEYLPNKSLDFFIFDETPNKQLDWTMRFNIINGISRGLLYLHEDSRLRIIHRDLKLSNILLDNDMNPKISDFGLAKSFWGNETAAKTRRVVGTYGYMSPEYAIDGQFSVKSDVFSFGVLVLEIITGKKNRGFYHPDHEHNLLGHVWKLFMEGRYLEVIDDLLTGSCDLSEVLRSIHIGLLCVQHCPKDRPKMSAIALMFSSEGPLPTPKEPGFFTNRTLFDPDSPLRPDKLCSVNEVTITKIDVR